MNLQTQAGSQNRFVESPRFSLILVTLGRVEELEQFCVYLESQNYRDFEVILVDQNEDERLGPLVNRFNGKFKLLRLHSEKGLSHGRNVGMKHARGDVIAFPDDDCWYEDQTLEKVAKLFVQHPEYDGITGRSVENLAESASKWFVFDRDAGPVSKTNVWRRSTSFTIFLRVDVIRQVGDFDEFLGVGSQSGRISGEEMDYLIRAIDNGLQIVYHPDLRVCHPAGSRFLDQKLIERGYGYSLGVGHVLRKHRYPLWFSFYFWLRAAGGILVSICKLDPLRARYHYAVLKGRVLGWLG